MLPFTPPTLSVFAYFRSLEFYYPSPAPPRRLQNQATPTPTRAMPAQQPASPLAPPPLTSTAALASTAAAFFPPWTSVEVSEEEVNDDAVSWLDGMAADLEAYLGEEEAAAAAAVAG